MAGATPRHGHSHQHGHYTPFSLTRLANFMGFSPRHQLSSQSTPRTAQRNLDGGDWIAVAAVASTSSFGGGEGTLGASSSAGMHDDLAAVRTPLTPFMMSANPFGKAPPPAMPSPAWSFGAPSHQMHPYTTSGTNSYGVASGSTTRPTAPTLVTDPLAALKGARTSFLPSPASTATPLSARAGPSTMFSDADTSTTARIGTKPSKMHYRQPSFAALDGGGIGESPNPTLTAKGKGREIFLVSDRTREKENEKIRRKEKERPMSNLPVGKTQKRISPSSPLIGSGTGTSTTHPQIGRAMGVRTSLLGFGTLDSASSMSEGDEFGNHPRKAPLPPSSSDPEMSHGRKLSEGGTNVLVSVREDSAEGRMGESTIRRRPAPPLAEETEPADFDVPPRRYIVITPPGNSDPHHASSIPLPPSQASQYSGSQPSPTTYQSKPPFTRGYTQTHTPNQSGSTDQKPPIPPKSSHTFLGRYRTLKAYSSTPNLLSNFKGKKAAAAPPVEDRRQTPNSNARRTQHLHPHMIQAQTICDAFMFPKPRFVAHVISPPNTPDVSPLTATSHFAPSTLLVPPSPLTLEKAIRDGEAREKEKLEWAARANQSLTRNRSYTVRSAVEHPSADTTTEFGAGLANRLRSRTLSGKRSAAAAHERGESKDTGARIARERSLKYQRSYEAFLATRKPPPSPPQDEVGRSISIRNTGPGKHGKLSVSVATASVGGGGGGGGGTVSSGNHTHSRKSSAGAGSNSAAAAGKQPHHQTGSSHPFAATHSRSASGSGSHAASVASYALRKVKSLCGPEEISPGAETGSFFGGSGGSQQRQSTGLRGNVRGNPAHPLPVFERRSPGGTAESYYEDDMFEALGDSHIVDISKPKLSPKVEVSSDREQEDDDEYEDDEEDDYGAAEQDLLDSYALASGRNSAMATASHSEGMRLSAVPSSQDDAASHLDMDDQEEDETAEIQQVTRRVSIAAAHSSSRQSIAIPSIPIDFVSNSRPGPTPSPSPSSYHGVYGIALGTPSLAHPFALSDDPETFAPPMSAGPHPTSPTYLQIPEVADVTARHRFPPNRLPHWPPPNTSLPSPPVTTEHEAMEEYYPTEHGDEPSSLRPLYAPPSARSSPPSARSSLPPSARAFHPYAAPVASPVKNVRMSVNSVEAMFGGELLESSHTVSPLGVREAGEWWINSTDADLKAPPPVKYDVAYRHSDDSGLGSSTDVHTAPSSPVRYTRGKRSRALTMESTASMLVESPPPSVFPSFRQDRSSGKFDTMTFGNGEGEELSVDGHTGNIPLADFIEEQQQQGQSPTTTSSSSSTSSIEVHPKPLGSSDDMESFKNLFYVPRSRQPSGEAPKVRRSDASMDTKVDMSPRPGDAASIAVGTPNARMISPLSSVLQMRDAFPDVEVAGPYRPNSSGDPRDRSAEAQYSRASVYDTIEEEESERSSDDHARSAEGVFRMGSVSVLSPNMTVGRHLRVSTQPSLLGEDTEPVAEALPRPRPQFIDIDSPYRASYLTTTSEISSGHRMSHIISDFPTPPFHNPSASALDYYGVSPTITPIDAADAYSFASPTSPLPPRPAVPFRSDSFGPA